MSVVRGAKRGESCVWLLFVSNGLAVTLELCYLRARIFIHGRTKVNFQFRPEKAIQSVGVLLNATSMGSMEFIRLLKLLYIAERRQLEKYGAPLVGGKLTAMKNGPLHSVVYDLIKGQSTLSASWNRYFQTNHHNIEKVDDPGVRDLSRAEVQLLRAISAEFEDMDSWDLVEHTHTFQEWLDTNVAPDTSATITPQALLIALKIPQVEIDGIFEAEQEAIQLQKELGVLNGLN